MANKQQDMRKLGKKGGARRVRKGFAVTGTASEMGKKGASKRWHGKKQVM